MSAVIFKTHNAVFTFNQNDVKELVARKKSEYDLDEVAKLLEAISADNIETIEIPEEPVYFDNIALDLIAAGNGSILCKTCNKTYVARQLNPLKSGSMEALWRFREKREECSNVYLRKEGNLQQCPVVKDMSALQVMT